MKFIRQNLICKLIKFKCYCKEINKRRIQIKGVVDFLITIALGVAIGAATLIVSSEMAKNKEETVQFQKISVKYELLENSKYNLVDEIQNCFKDYLLAKKKYEEAVNLNKSNEEINKAYLLLLKAKGKLEQRILLLFPGVTPSVGSFSK